MEYEEVILSVKVEVKPVPAQQDSFNSGTLRNSFRQKPCSFCSFKGFDHQHYLLDRHCGITKLSSKEILQVMKRINACFTCEFQHTSNADCKSTFQSGDSKACRKGCLHNGIPVNLAICKHNDESPSVTVLKVGSNKAIPMMDILQSSPSQWMFNMIQDVRSALSLHLHCNYSQGPPTPWATPT